jgi:formamidopyrimidine-DNA glycosylase
VPELPEVETIRRGLAPRILGRRIVKAELRLAKLVRGCAPGTFARAIEGRRFEAVDRRAKYLLFRLSGARTWMVHLGMSGQLGFWDHRLPEDPRFSISPLTGLQRSQGQHPADRHTHLLLHLEGGDRVQYRDIRQFGHFRLVGTGEESSLASLRRLGLEPLDGGFTYQAFEAALKGRRGMVKALLLNQTAVVGLGNIYSDEACFAAGIHPRRRVESLGPERRRALYAAIKAVLDQALDSGGTTLRDYRRADGTHGLNQDRLQAYGREGEPCLRCGSVLRKTTVAQRTTVFCPRCQKQEAKRP